MGLNIVAKRLLDIRLKGRDDMQDFLSVVSRCKPLCQDLIFFGGAAE